MPLRPERPSSDHRDERHHDHERDLDALPDQHEVVQHRLLILSHGAPASPETARAPPAAARRAAHRSGRTTRAPARACPRPIPPGPAPQGAWDPSTTRAHSQHAHFPSHDAEHLAQLRIRQSPTKVGTLVLRSQNDDVPGVRGRQRVRRRGAGQEIVRGTHESTPTLTACRTETSTITTAQKVPPKSAGDQDRPPDPMPRPV